METETDNRAPWGSPARAPEWQGSLVRLLPVRVLVISGDRAFSTTIATLLTRRGMYVETAPSEAEAAAQAAEMRPDVLLYDLAGVASRDGSAARHPEAIRMRILAPGARPPAGVVLVGEACETAALTVLDRWGEFSVLFEAIVEADLARAPLVPADGRRPPLRAV